MKKLELPEERRFYAWIKKHTLLEILKLNVRGRRGWPDRLLLGNGPLIIFFEFKRPDDTGTLSKLQEIVISELKKYGFKVYVVRSFEEAKEIATREIQAASISKKSDKVRRR